MSFRGQLTLFFVAIVVVPMVAVAVLVIRVTDDSRAGKADARLAAGLETARVLYEEALAEAPTQVERLSELERVPNALRAGTRGPLLRVAEQQVDRPRIARVAFFDGAGEQLAAAGAPAGIASARREIQSTAGQPLGAIEVAALDPQAFAAEIAELTGSDVAIVAAQGTLAETAPLQAAGAAGATPGSVDLPALDDGRAAALALEGAPPDARLVLAVPAEEGFVASEPLVAVILLGFFGLAVGFVLVLMRALRHQTAEMLDAAHRIGEGDFSREVPVQGNDEMAGLAREFNKMSGRLNDQMAQLRRQREELDRSVERIGEAFASGLDRSTLLQIVVETAVSACDATAGRITISDHEEVAAQVSIAPGSEAEAALAAAQGTAAERRGAAAAERGDARAIADVLHAPGAPDELIGTMAIARRGHEFSDEERRVLRYLIGQAAASVENIGLHERVAEQAVTDELTGLANRRHFRDWVERESERRRRFGGELSLVILDVDDFKEVNDVRGHPQGDRVLATIGRVLQVESRGVDEVARYGGEEFVLALPETPAPGASEVAERVRARIAETVVPPIDGGEPLRVTASLGVATMPADAADVDGLIAAADAALYRAKQAGKNRVERASGPLARAQGNPLERRS